MFLRLDPEEAMSSRLRGQPYGADLRERVLAATGETIRSVGARFSVSPSYVSKVRTQLHETYIVVNAGPAAQSRSASSGTVL